MDASTVMLVAIVAAVVGRWSHGGKAADAKAVVEAMFAVVFIAFLDHGHTEPVAKGFAYLFLAAVLLGKNTPLTGITKVMNAKPPAQGKRGK